MYKNYPLVGVVLGNLLSSSTITQSNELHRTEKENQPKIF